MPAHPHHRPVSRAVARGGPLPLARCVATLLLPLLLGACSQQDTSRSTPDTAAGNVVPGAPERAGRAAESAGVQGEHPPAQPASARRWTFDSAQTGAAPPGFVFGRTGQGAAGRWVVQAAPDAPSGPNVLAQADTDRTDNRFPVAVADAPVMRDGTVSVRCKPVSGRVDQACGLVFRFRDADNYYIARANALEDNVRLYTVRDGRRREIASWNGRVTPRAWHELRAEVDGDRIRVSWDGRQVIEKRDTTFPEAGRVGVWTKADSYTLFDDLTVTPR
jgi:hypothetical protein